MGHDWFTNQRAPYAEARIRELTELREEIRLAQAVRPAGRLRRRLGALLIITGHRLIGPSLDAPCAEGALAVARKR